MMGSVAKEQPVHTIVPEDDPLRDRDPQSPTNNLRDGRDDSDDRRGGDDRDGGGDD